MRLECRHRLGDRRGRDRPPNSPARHRPRLRDTIHHYEIVATRRDVERTRIRTLLLSAVGVDPARADTDAAAEVVTKISTSLVERPDDLALRRVRAQLLGLRMMTLGAATSRGEIDLLRSDLTALVRAFPRDAALRETLDDLDGRGSRRRR